MEQQLSMLGPSQLISSQDLIMNGWWWLMATVQIVVTSAGLGSIVYFLRRLVRGQDEMGKTVHRVDKSAAITETKLDDHIENDALHCKGAGCLAIRERVA